MSILGSSKANAFLTTCRLPVKSIAIHQEVAGFVGTAFEVSATQGAQSCHW